MYVRFSLDFPVSDSPIRTTYLGLNSFFPEDGCSMYRRNIGINQQHYTVSEL